MQHGQNGFTFEEINGWQAIAELNRPKAPSPADCLIAPQVQSYSAVATRRGMVLTLTVDGQDISLNINAVLSSSLIRIIARAGYQMKWLARDGRVQNNL